MSGQGKSLAYRPGLDGFRALAVAAVLLYHARVPGTAGGFIGVDMFFVLSGFLITSLLLAEHTRTGGIDLVRFWMGRVRRLLPAALLVIAASLLAVAILSSEDLPALRADAFWSVLYVNNWHQILADRSYFEAFGRPSPLEHFWSLAVEEQFYLLWPLLLLLGLRLRRLGPTRVALLALCAAIASAVLMGVLYDPHNDPSRIYYGTDTRAMPLLLGVALAFAWPAMREARPVTGSARAALDAIGLTGLAIVLVGVLAWRDFDPFVYRGGLALVALGAALLIASAAHPSSRVGRGLAWTPLVWIGARSYGIYLWHWPVMALSRPDLDVRVSSWVLVPLQVALTVALAALSYRFVEMPIRRGELQARVRAWAGGLRASRRRALLPATAGVVLLFVALVLAWPTALRTVPTRESASVLAQALPQASVGLPVLPPAQATTPPRTTATTPAPPRGPILAVGASVMLAAIGPLQHDLHARVDAAVARQPGAIQQRLQQYRDAGRLPPVVVVQTGENGPLYYADQQALRAVLRGVPRVVLVTVRQPTASWSDDTNAKLKELAEGWPQARLADWHAASGDPDLLWDGAHPNARGAKVYARTVARALRR